MNETWLDEQQRIMAYLDSVQARLASLRETVAEAKRRVQGLFESLLAESFL